MSSVNQAREFVELRTFYGLRQMKLYREMMQRNDWPLNDCQLFINLSSREALPGNSQGRYGRAALITRS